MDAMRHVQVKVSAPAETAAAFKAKCRADGVSMAAEITGFMAGRIGLAEPRKPDIRMETRGCRRKAVKALAALLETVIEAERRYMESIPENLTGSRFHEAAERTVETLEEAVDLLKEAY